jgi:hypothetical protein
LEISLLKDISQARNMLQQVIDKGINYFDHIKKDTHLNNIRNSACYKSIMAGKQNSNIGSPWTEKVVGYEVRK